MIQCIFEICLRILIKCRLVPLEAQNIIEKGWCKIILGEMGCGEDGKAKERPTEKQGRAEGVAVASSGALSPQERSD